MITMARYRSVIPEYAKVDTPESSYKEAAIPLIEIFSLLSLSQQSSLSRYLSLDLGFNLLQ
jgi:hypothetical protein